jgi:hypothetical protein
MALSFAMCFKEREVDGFISFKAWHASRALASPACLKGTRLLNLALLKPGFVQHGGTRSGLAQAVRAPGPADLKRLRQQLEQENAKLKSPILGEQIRREYNEIPPHSSVGQAHEGLQSQSTQLRLTTSPMQLRATRSCENAASVFREWVDEL